MQDTPPADSAPKVEVEILPTSNGNSDIVNAKPVIPDTGFLPLQDFMGMSHPDDEQKEKLQYIWDSFGKGRDRAETLEAIKEAKYRLSPPALGENYLHKLYSYTRLIEEGRSVEREKRVYEGDNILGDS